jgi:hypothetical protein
MRALNVMNREETSCLASKVESLVGALCKGILFGGMASCNERYTPGATRGHHELTWGVILRFSDKEPLVLTWNENSSFGDPFFLDYAEAVWFEAIDSLEIQDVTAIPPWETYVGTTLRNCKVLTYETNYSKDGNGTWRSMPWGVELTFESGSLLIGAMHHGDFMRYKICADEIVIVWDTAIIEKVKVSRAGQKSEWKNTTV